MASLTVQRLADGSARYVTVDGDIVDHLCWRHYGREWETTEVVLGANPGLAARGPILPAGVEILLPAISVSEQPSRRASVRLFDAD